MILNKRPKGWKADPDQIIIRAWDLDVVCGAPGKGAISSGCGAEVTLDREDIFREITPMAGGAVVKETYQWMCPFCGECQLIPPPNCEINQNYPVKKKWMKARWEIVYTQLKELNPEAAIEFENKRPE